MSNSDNSFINFTLILFGITLIFLILQYFKTFMIPFTIALILTIIFGAHIRGSFLRAENSKQRRKYWNKFFTFLTLFLLIIFLIGYFVNYEIKNSNILDSDLENTKLNLLNNDILISDILEKFNIKQNILEISKLFLAGFSNFLSQIFLLILFLIFLLPSYNNLLKKIYSNLNEKKKNKFYNSILKIEKGISEYIYLKTGISFLTAILSAIILFLFGAEYIFLFSFIIFILNFIPNIGSFLAIFIIGVLNYFFISSGVPFLMMMILLISIQIIIGNLIEPKLFGKKLKLSPVIIILSLFFWSALWGIIGALLAVPLTMIIKIILENINSTKRYIKYIE